MSSSTTRRRTPSSPPTCRGPSATSSTRARGFATASPRRRSAVPTAPGSSPDSTRTTTESSPTSRDTRTLRDPQDTLPVWLARRRLPHRVRRQVPERLWPERQAPPAPGFDSWFAFLGAPGYYDYRRQRQRQVAAISAATPADYSTDVFTRHANAFLGRARIRAPRSSCGSPMRPPTAGDRRSRPCQRPELAAAPRRSRVSRVQGRSAPAAAVVQRAERLRQAAAIRDLPRARRPRHQANQERLALHARHRPRARPGDRPGDGEAPERRGGARTPSSSTSPTTGTSSASTGDRTASPTCTSRRSTCRIAMKMPRPTGAERGSATTPRSSRTRTSPRPSSTTRTATRRP